MSDDTKQTIEIYVTSALKKRIADAASAAGTAKAEILAAIQRLEQALLSTDERFDLPDDLLPAPPPTPPAAEVGLLGHVFSAQKELIAATDQVGLLTQLLLGCTVSCSRVAFFILKKDVLAGWAARGFDRALDTDVRSLSIPILDDTILGDACRSGATVRSRPGSHAQDGRFLSRLGGDMPSEAMAVPIWIRDKVAAVLYGDSGKDEQILDPEVPEILGIHAGLCLETLATRQKSPRPKASESAPQIVAPAQPLSAAPASVVSMPGPISMAGTAGPAPAASTQATGSNPSTPSAPMSASGPRPAVSPVQPAPSAAPAPSFSQTGAQSASAPYAPALSLDDIPEDERKFHEEARRFARLLVSEIVLYNERQVEEGRRQKDLYDRLREDIDRSRGMYEQRVNAKVRTVTNYFYQELVRTLANGDESAIKVPWA